MAPSRRGFAAMDPEKQRQIAAKGGRSHGRDNQSNRSSSSGRSTTSSRRGRNEM